MRSFAEVCEISNKVGQAWLEATQYMQYHPSPLNGFELFNHMAVATMARGKQESLDGFLQLIDEYETVRQRAQVHVQGRREEPRYV